MLFERPQSLRQGAIAPWGRKPSPFHLSLLASVGRVFGFDLDTPFAEIPPEARTIVVVPVILPDEATVATLIDKLEIAYLANRDDHLHFALLGSFADANSEKLPNDESIVEAARHGIEELNRRYSDGKPIRFHLFHRCRQWCESCRSQSASNTGDARS